MKKYILIAVALIGCFVSAYAITDEQLAQRALELQKQGKSEQVIARQLVSMGATAEQLQRLKQEMTGESTKAAATASSSDAVIRTNSGEKTPASAPPASNVFGSNIFRSKKLSFEPQANLPTPQNYMLGAGDELIIDVYGASQLQVKRVISPEGMITFQDYGPVKVGGLSIQDATRRIKQTFGTRYQGSQLMVSLGQTRSIQVNIMGEVSAPGTYQLSAFASVFHALYVAGGVTDAGTLRNIRVFRNGKLIGTADIYDYLLNGKTDDIRLSDGDIIIVDPYDQHVQVSGNIRRPMVYELKKGESLSKLIYYAGGFSANAYTAAVRIARSNGGHSVLTVANEQFDAFAMADADAVSVEAVIDRLENTVSINGAVFRPGQYGLSDNLRTVGQLIGMADGPIETAFLGRGVLYRMKLDRTRMAVPIDLEGIINGTAEDIALLNEDEVYVPDTRAQLQELTVKISGEVRQPQTFPFAENESVEDLVLRAGGLTKNASTSKVDIVRRKIDPKATDELAVRSETFVVELNERMPLGEKGFVLEPYDEVYVRRSPAAATPMNASILGEVVFSGQYELHSKSDRLSDLVKACGGLTAYAYVTGARLIRQMNEEELAQRNKLAKKYTKDENDTTTIKALDLSSTYSVGINLQKALDNPGSGEDIILREGDVLYVPTVISTVKINGDVLYPNAVTYLPGKNARFYIRQAGGFGETARRSKAYILYPGGKTKPAWYGKVIAGSEIIVPSKGEKEERTSSERISTASAVASMASTLATISMVGVQISNTLKK